MEAPIRAAVTKSATITTVARTAITSDVIPSFECFLACSDVPLCSIFSPRIEMTSSARNHAFIREFRQQPDAGQS